MAFMRFVVREGTPMLSGLKSLEEAVNSLASRFEPLDGLQAAIKAMEARIDPRNDLQTS